MSVCQVVFGQFQDNGNENKKLLYCVFRDMALELLDYWAVVFDDLRLFTLELGNLLRLDMAIIRFSWVLTELEDVVHLHVVLLAGKGFS